MSSDLKVSDNVKVYVGGEGIKVALALVLPVDSGKALIEVSGSDSPVEKVVRLHEKESNAAGHSWRTKHKGREFYTLRIEKDRWGGGESVRCWIPGGGNDGLYLTYDGELSKLVKSEELLNRHLRQASEGTLEALAAYKRDEYVAQAQKGFDEVKARADQECGVALDASVDYSTITDEALMKYSIGSYCGSPLAALARLVSHASVDDKPVYTSRIQERVKKFRASAGKRPTLTLAGGELTWVTTWDESNLDEMAYQVLRNELNKR